MKILYVTTIGATMGFFRDFIKKLINEGHTVDIATNQSTSKVPEIYEELGCKIYNISCTRSPLNKNTVRAIGEIKKIVNENEYDIVHCHTPIAAMCTRLACIKARKKGTKVFYTAHGFHFYKGAPLKNWLMYYPIEKICSYFTDTLITINKEDYALACKKMKAKKIEYVHGVGLDTQKIFNTVVDRQKKREELGISDEAVMLLSVGELNQNKNHETVIKALAQVNDKNVHYFIAGTGGKEEYLKSLAEDLGISENVHILGFRSDVVELYKSADVFVHPSFREGLPVSLMEAMCSGLPCIVSQIRGNQDLVENSLNGFCCNPFNEREFADAIEKFVADKKMREEMGKQNIEKVKLFDISNVINDMEKIYKFYGVKNEKR